VNASHRLEKLSKAAKKRITKLRSHVSPFSAPTTAEQDRIIAWVVVETLNLWAGFLRAYYLSGAIGTRTSLGGRVIYKAVTFPNSKAAIVHAIRAVKNPLFSKRDVSRRDEPPWHDTNNFLSLLQNVDASNLSQIYAAFSTGVDFFDFLPTVRNFYAHRCDETFRKATRVGMKLGLATMPKLRPTEIMCARLPKRPSNVITEWLDDMANVVDLLCS
jgi:hypothetical protein